MEKTTYGTKKEILKYPEKAIAVAVTLDRTAFTSVVVEGEIPAGTLVHFDLKNRATKGIPAAADKLAVGVLRHDTKVTGHDADSAAVIIEGYIDLAKVTAPAAEQETALAPYVRFIQ